MTDNDQVQWGEAVAGLSMLAQLLLNIFNFKMQGSQKSMADPFFSPQWILKISVSSEYMLIHCCQLVKHPWIMGDYKQLALFSKVFIYIHSEAVLVRAGTVVLCNETLDLGKLSREL